MKPPPVTILRILVPILRYTATLIVLAVVLALSACSQSPAVKKQKALERAEQYLKDGKPNEAIIELRNALQVDKDFVPALYALGRAYSAKAWYADAARELSRAQTLAPDSVPVAAQLGRALVELGAWSDAEAAAELVLSREPRSGDGIFVRVATLLGQRRLEEALAVLEMASRGGLPLTAELQSVRAEALLLQGKPQEAEQVYQAVIASNPKDARSLAGLAGIMLGRGKPEEAARLYTAARAVRPADARIRVGLAVAKDRLGKREEAIRELEEVDGRARTPAVLLALGEMYLKANRASDASSVLAPVVQRAPKYARARYLLGSAYLAGNRPDQALVEFEELNKQVPNDPLIQYRLARAYARRGRAREALVLLNGLAKPLEKAAEYHAERGRVLLLLGRREEALRAAGEAQRLAPQNPQPYLLLGHIHSQGGNSKAAREMYAKAAEVDSGFAPAHMALGRLHAAEKDMDAALKEFDLAAQADPQSVVVARTKAAALVQQDRAKEAVQYVEGLVKAQPREAGFQSLLGGLHSRDRRWDMAAAAYKKAVEIDPKAVEPRLGLARVALAQEREDEATAHLQAVVKERPAQPAAVLLLGALHERRAQYDQAIQVLEAAAKADPRQQAFVLSLGDLYLKKGRYDEALARMSELLGEAPELAGARLIRAQAHLFKGDGAAALKDVSAVVSANPKSDRAQYMLARTNAALGRLPEAQAAYREALKLNPEMAAAKAELATLSGQKPEAGAGGEPLATLQEGVKKEPRNPALREELARALLSAGKLKEAQVELKQVLDQAPGRGSANYLMAIALGRDGRPDEAATHLTALLRTNPSHVEGNVLMAVHLQRQGRREEAIKHLEAALRVNPGLGGIKLQLGHLYLVSNRLPDALRIAQELERAAPKSPEPPLLRGMALLAQRKAPEALEAFGAALKIKPDLADAHRGSGQAHEMLGQADRAVASYQRALAIKGDDVTVLNNLAWLLAEVRRKPEEALPLASKAAQLAPQAPEVADTLGWIHYRRGKFADAEKLLVPAAERAPKNATIQYHLGMTYYRLGKKGDAASMLRRAATLDPKLGEREKLQDLIKEIGG